jgi:hypothetical protein
LKVTYRIASSRVTPLLRRLEIERFVAEARDQLLVAASNGLSLA